MAIQLNLTPSSLRAREDLNLKRYRFQFFPRSGQKKLFKITTSDSPAKYLMYSRTFGITMPSGVQCQVRRIHTQILRVMEFQLFYEMFSVEFDF